MLAPEWQFLCYDFVHVQFCNAKQPGQMLNELVLGCSYLLFVVAGVLRRESHIQCESSTFTQPHHHISFLMGLQWDRCMHAFLSSKVVIILHVIIVLMLGVVCLTTVY